MMCFKTLWVVVDIKLTKGGESPGFAIRIILSFLSYDNSSARNGSGGPGSAVLITSTTLGDEGSFISITQTRLLPSPTQSWCRLCASNTPSGPFRSKLTFETWPTKLPAVGSLATNWFEKESRLALIMSIALLV